MKKIVLISTNNKTPGTSCTLPIVGTVKFDLENKIEIDEDKWEELKKKNFGIELLTPADFKLKKDAKKAEIKNKDRISVLHEPNKHPLEICLAALKNGREVEDVEFLDSQIKIIMHKKYDTMLASLDDTELQELLINYPSKEIKDLKTKEDIIGFLKSKVK